MSVTPFARLPDGREVQQVTLSNDRLRADFLTLGARINGLRFDGIDGLTPVLDMARATGDDQYSGAIVGPVINRLGDAKALLNDEVLRFAANEGPNLLHSGADGIHDKFWQIAAVGETDVTFALDMAPDAFPGQRRIEVTYRLDGPDLWVDIWAKTDAPTLMNVGFHPYWTLSRNGRDAHQLLIDADCYLETGPAKISTGNIASVLHTSLDYTEMRDADFDVDHCFVQSAGNAPSVSLQSHEIRLDITTDAPAIQVFTGHASGIAVEPEIHPNAPNIAAFPSIRLAPGEAFQQSTRHRFSKR